MTQQPQKTSKQLSRRTVLFAAIGALVLTILANGYFYSLEGAQGLYVWHPVVALKILLFMGLGPISLAILALPLEKLAQKWIMRVLRWISCVGSILVSLVSIGMLAFLIVVPRLGSMDPVRLNLVDPSQGIVTQSMQSEAAFSAGGDSTTGTASDVTMGATASGTAQLSGAAPAALTTQAAPSAAPLSPLDRPLLRLAFSSDPHWGADTANAGARADVLKGIEASRPDAFFMLGDTVETGNSAIQWNLALLDLEAFVSDVPLRPLLGNHDALFGGQYLYRKAFFPQGFSSDSGSPYYWSIEAGPQRSWRWICPGVPRCSARGRRRGSKRPLPQPIPANRSSSYRTAISTRRATMTQRPALPGTITTRTSPHLSHFSRSMESIS